jgi:long-chain acyl-CoA synthetase
MEWVLAEHAIFSLGGCTVPLYETLGPDTVLFVLQQTGARAVVCTRAELTALGDAKATGQLPDFVTAILVDGVTPDAARFANTVGLKVMSYAKVEAVGAHRIATQGHDHYPPKPTDVATFCYTSGTTGDPKGALITHQNLIAAIAGMQLLPGLSVQISDRHLSYLPLAHIFERVVMAQLFVAGASVAFFRGDPAWLIEDLQACRPTIMPVAPRVLNKIYDKVHSTRAFLCVCVHFVGPCSSRTCHLPSLHSPPSTK